MNVNMAMSGARLKTVMAPAIRVLRNAAPGVAAATVLAACSIAPGMRMNETPTLPTGVVKTDVERFRVQTVAKTGAPYGFAFLPDGRILITEQSGSLRVVEKGRLLPEPIADAPTGGVEGRRGQPGHNLLDVIIDPDYAHNGWIYLSSARRAKPGDPAGGAIARITRGKIRDGRWVDREEG